MNDKQKTLEEKRNDQIVSDALRLKSMVGLSLSNEECQRFIKGIYNEAAELYAGQTKQSEKYSAIEKAVEIASKNVTTPKVVREGIVTPISKQSEPVNGDLQNKIVNILEYFERGLSDVAVGSGEDQPMLSEIKEALTLLKSSPVSLEVEKSDYFFYYFPNHGDDDGKNCWTVCYGNEGNDNDEIILTTETEEWDAQELCRRLNKIISEQSQQPASVAFFSEEEIDRICELRFSADEDDKMFKLGIEVAQSELRKRVNAADPDQVLNDVLNGFVSGKYKRPTDSNSIAQFVIDYLKTK